MEISKDIQEILDTYGAAAEQPEPEHKQQIVDSIQKQIDEEQKKSNQEFAFQGATKRRFVIEHSSWGPTLEDRQSSDFQLGEPREIPIDPLREAAGKYWSYNKGISDTGEPQKVMFISKGPDHDMNANVPFKTIVSPPEFIASADPAEGGERSPFFHVQQVVMLDAHRHAFVDEQGNYKSENWHALISGFSGDEPQGNQALINEYVDYNYMAFDMPLPYNYRQLDKLNIQGPQYVRSVGEYNFYIRDYEEPLRFGDVANQTERILPNLYAMIMEKQNEASNEYFAEHISLGGIIKDGASSLLATKEFDIKKHSGQYFDIYGRRISDALQGEDAAAPKLEGALKQIVDKYQNLVIPEASVPLLKQASRQKELFPMFVDMEFSTDTTTEFAQMLSDTKLLDEFMWSFVKDVVTIGGHTNMEFTEVEEVTNVSVLEDGTSTVEKVSETKKHTRKTWNVLEWLKRSSLVDFTTGEVDPTIKQMRSFQEATALEKVLFVDDGQSENSLRNPSTQKFFKSIFGIILLGKMKTFLKKKFVTYDKMMEGHTCDSEDVLYRVEKSLADDDGNPTGEVIQNFWFPNTNDSDRLNFIDTQIKYGKRYAYKFYAYKLAVNNKYGYSNTTVFDDVATFVVTQRPELLIIEQEVFLDDHIILDDPPVPPEVEMVPYFADGNRLLLNLKSAVGEYLLEPILLNEEDDEQLQDVRRAQKLDDSDKIRFKGDDKGGSFEIYRIDDPPSDWSDFDNSMLAAISNQNASTGEYIDYISSNMKYYYTFRMVDVHGHVSNPTDVYEIELVNDEGSIYLNKRIVDFKPREPKIASKPMRRLLEIKVAPEQRFLDFKGEEESAMDIKNIKLGHLQESPWGRKFKFRIVSKKTGKKIDFNVDFKAEMDKGSALK